MNKTLFIDSALTAVGKSNAYLKGEWPDKWWATNELTDEEIEAIAGNYHSWRYVPGSAGGTPANAGGTPALPGYEDLAGYCKSATLEEIRKNDYILTPGRYVEAPPLERDNLEVLDYGQ